MKHVLLVVAYWPPRIDSGTLRWAAMAPHLLARGWRPVILTPSTGPDAHLDAELEASVADLETWRVDGDVAARVVAKLNREPAEATGRADLWPDDRAHRALTWARRALVFPDARAPWAALALRAALRRGRGRRFDAVISSAPPPSVHLVAAGAAAAWRVPWIADHRDPWFFSSRVAPVGPARIAQRALRVAVDQRAAHHLVATAHAEQVLAARGVRGVTLIRNGYDAQQRTLAPERGNVLRIAHVGVLHHDRHRREMWEALAAALEQGRLPRASLKIDIAGPAGAAVRATWRRCGLDDVVTDHGVVSHAEALRLMQRADVLLVLGSRDPLAAQQVPAKLYESLVAGAHVVGAFSEDSEAAALLRAHGHRVISEGSVAAWRRVFEDLVTAYMRGDRIAPSVGPSLAELERGALADRVVACLDGAVDRAGAHRRATGFASGSPAT